MTFLDARRGHLRNLLLRYEPWDDRESRHAGRMLSLLDVAGDPFARDHWVPGHFTASAFVLAPDRQRTLLVFHEKLRRWLQPGGHVDANDATLLDSALREVAEETSIVDPEHCLDYVLDVDVHSIPSRGRDPVHEHFDVRFLFVARDDRFRAGSDAVDARWIPLENVATIETDASVLRAIDKIRNIVK